MGADLSSQLIGPDQVALRKRHHARCLAGLYAADGPSNFGLFHLRVEADPGEVVLRKICKVFAAI